LKKHLVFSAVLLVLLLALLPALSGCGSRSGQTNATVWGEGTDKVSPEAKAADDALAALTKSAAIETPATLKSGALLAGCDSSSPPFGFLANLITKVNNKEVKTSKIVGFEVDLCTAVAKKLGLSTEFVSTSWKALLPALKEGTIDLVVSGVATNPGRLQQYDATDVYLPANLAIITSTERPLAGAGDLKGKIVGVQLDTVAQSVVKDEGGVDVRTYPQVLGALRDLTSGKLDAVVAEEPICLWILQNDTTYEGKYAITGRIETDDGYAFWCKKGNEGLLAVMNAALQELREVPATAAVGAATAPAATGTTMAATSTTVAATVTTVGATSTTVGTAAPAKSVYQLICEKWGLTGN
jgi:ABC-type amino acid transport substrate-binding protein